MRKILNLLKYIFGIASGILSILLLVYLSMKNENMAIVDDSGIVIINKSMGIFIIIAWAVVGLIFLLLDYFYKRNKNK